MKTCNVCGNEIAKSAKICPHCGAKNKKPFYKKIWFWVLVIIILLGACSGGNDEPINSTSNTDNPVKTQDTQQPEPVQDDNVTTGQKNALKSAKNYLAFTAFSYEGLIDQLEYEQYSTEEATYAVDNCGADWNEQALLCAKNYLDFSAFSYEGLIEQLEYEQFTSEQAKYAADNCGADWNEQAAKCAKNYLDFSSFSRAELIDQLEYEGFTSTQAEYGVQQNGY